MEENGVFIESKKLRRNARRFQCRIVIKASLDEVWRVLTDYERMLDVLPSVTVSKIIERHENRTRVLQGGQQDLAFGLKISSKITMDCYERDLEVFDLGKKRDIDFKMVESDFTEIFEGKWSIEQLNKGIGKDGEEDSSSNEGNETTLRYSVDLKPKLWLPIQLGEGRFMKEVKMNQISIRDEVMRLAQNAQSSA